MSNNTDGADNLCCKILSFKNVSNKNLKKAYLLIKFVDSKYLSSELTYTTCSFSRTTNSNSFVPKNDRSFAIFNQIRVTNCSKIILEISEKNLFGKKVSVATGHLTALHTLVVNEPTLFNVVLSPAGECSVELTLSEQKPNKSIERANSFQSSREESEFMRNHELQKENMKRMILERQNSKQNSASMIVIQQQGTVEQLSNLSSGRMTDCHDEATAENNSSAHQDIVTIDDTSSMGELGIANTGDVDVLEETTNCPVGKEMNSFRDAGSFEKKMEVDEELTSNSQLDRKESMSAEISTAFNEQPGSNKSMSPKNQGVFDWLEMQLEQTAPMTPLEEFETISESVALDSVLSMLHSESCDAMEERLTFPSQNGTSLSGKNFVSKYSTIDESHHEVDEESVLDNHINALHSSENEVSTIEESIDNQIALSNYSVNDNVTKDHEEHYQTQQRRNTISTIGPNVVLQNTPSNKLADILPPPINTTSSSFAHNDKYIGIDDQQDAADSGQILSRKLSSKPKRSQRYTLSTVRNVSHWDDKGMSVADSVKAMMEERIANHDIQTDEEFSTAGMTAGVEVWVIDDGKAVGISEVDIGHFYNADCYIILNTIENEEFDYSWSVHTWIGTKAAKDKATIAAFKAKYLCNHFGIPHTIRNLENEESDELIEILYGNFEVHEGAIAKSSLKRVISKVKQSPGNPARLLMISNTQSTSVLSLSNTIPVLKSIPLARSSLKPDRALILDSGGSIIFQWRGSEAPHIARARVFEAAFSLRGERIQSFPDCKIEVVDEGNEPEHFWELISSRQMERMYSNLSSMEEECEIVEDIENTEHLLFDSFGENSATKYDTDIETDQSMEEKELDDQFADEQYENDDYDDDMIKFDMKEIEGYCEDLSRGHAEMLRRRVACRSVVLSPDLVYDDQVPFDDANFSNLRKTLELQNTSTSESDIGLYRIGYINNQLHCARLSGINAAGDDFGPLKQSDLETSGIYILDCYDEVYLWIGKKSSKDLRTAGIALSEALIKNNKPHWVQLINVYENNEPMMFKSKFPNWDDRDSVKTSKKFASQARKASPQPQPRRQLKDVVAASVGNMLSELKKVEKPMKKRPNAQKTICRSFSLKHIKTPLDESLDKDDGTGVAVVWKITSEGLRPVAKENQGHFWSHESYVILYGFTIRRDANEEEIYEFVLYFWQGYHSKEKAYLQWKMSFLPQKKEEWLAQMGKMPLEIRVFQSMEPVHFLKIFAQRYIVHFPFLNIKRQKEKAQKKAEEIQTEILRNEKLRTPYMQRRIIPRSTSLQSFNISSPPKQRTPLLRDLSFTSIATVESTVGDCIAAYSSPLQRSQFTMETTVGALLYHVRGYGLHEHDIHAVQIEAKANKLNSSDCFIAVRPLSSGNSFVWLWVGRGASIPEQIAAGALATKLMKWVGGDSSNQVRVIEEGVGEWMNRWIAKSFYRALGGFDIYTNYYLLQTPRNLRPPSLRYPTLFTCDFLRGEYSVVMHKRFSQHDLQPAGAAILDAHFAIFVWYGRSCSASLRVISLKVATRFMGNLHTGYNTLSRKPVEVNQDFEPPAFTTNFHGWADWVIINKEFIDPRQIRLNVRKRMGMLGDMELSIGRPINGVTVEETQQKVQKIKEKLKKIEAKRPQQDSIRDRIRSRVMTNIREVATTKDALKLENDSTDVVSLVSFQSNNDADNFENSTKRATKKDVSEVGKVKVTEANQTNNVYKTPIISKSKSVNSGDNQVLRRKSTTSTATSFPASNSKETRERIRKGPVSSVTKFERQQQVLKQHQVTSASAGNNLLFGFIRSPINTETSSEMMKNNNTIANSITSNVPISKAFTNSPSQRSSSMSSYTEKSKEKLGEANPESPSLSITRRLASVGNRIKRQKQMKERMMSSLK